MAHLTITHTHDAGTLLTGSTKDDGVLDIVRTHGFTWRRHRGICVNASRDRDAKTWYIDAAAAALRDAGHEVTIDIDNAPRPTAVVEAERADRAAARADRLTDRAGKAAARGDARERAARHVLDGIPLGQPMLVGHHSYKADRNRRERANANDRKAMAEGRYAATLAQRSAGVAANQRHRESGRTTMRRIEKFEADKRRTQRAIDGYQRNFTNSRGEIFYVEKHPPAEGARREQLQGRLAHLDEQIAYWRGQLDAQAEAGAFVPWGKEHFVKGDQVRHEGFDAWYTVTRVNTKSVSVNSEGWPRTITWDEVAGRRRDGMQRDTPNGEPWPVELARKVARWQHLQRLLRGNDSSTKAIAQRCNIELAQRIALGLDRQASTAEVEAFTAAVDDTQTSRHVQAAFVDVYDRLAAGDKAAGVQATTVPLALAPVWRMPNREAEDRIAHRSIFARHDFSAVQPGDLIVGSYDSGRGTTLVRNFCGPVVSVSEVNNRREAGEWITITLADGNEMTCKTHRWFAVHPAGTWDDITATDDPHPGIEQHDGEPHERAASRPHHEPDEAPDPWGPVLDKIETLRAAP